MSGTPESDDAIDFQVLGPDGPNGAPSGLTVGYDERTVDRTFEERYSISKTEIRNGAPGFEQIAERDVEIPGAEGARLLSFHYMPRQGVRSTEHVVVAVGQGGDGVGLRLSGAQEIVTDEMVQAVIDSLRFTG